MVYLGDLGQMDRLDNGSPGGYKSPDWGVPKRYFPVSNLRQHIVAAFVSVGVVAPIAWMIMDRTPPYTRLSGEVIPATPRPSDDVSINWETKVHRNCPPSTDYNVTRTIIDSIGKRHEYEPIEGVYGTETQTSSTLVRVFKLPDNVSIGPARYRSSACFACNPMHYFWPVCVSEPEIKFEVVRP